MKLMSIEGVMMPQRNIRSFLVKVELPPGTTESEMADYIRDAVKIHHGGMDYTTTFYKKFKPSSVTVKNIPDYVIENRPTRLKVFNPNEE